MLSDNLAEVMRYLLLIGEWITHLLVEDHEADLLVGRNRLVLGWK